MKRTRGNSSKMTIQAKKKKKVEVEVVGDPKAMVDQSGGYKSGADYDKILKLTDEAAIQSDELQMIKAEAKIMVGKSSEARNILLSLRSRSRYEQSVSGRPEDMTIRQLCHRYWYVKSLVSFYAGTLPDTIITLKTALECLESDPANAKTSLLKNKLTRLNQKYSRVLSLEEQLRATPQRPAISKGRVDQLSEEKFKLLMVCLNILADIQKILPRRNKLILSRIFRLLADIRNNENSKMYDIVSAYRFVTLAVKLNPNSWGNYSMKGKILGKLKQYRHAIVQLQIYAKYEQSNPEVKRDLELCKKALFGNVTTKKYYRILGLQPSCTRRDIRLAYKTFVLTRHPDKNTTNPAEVMERRKQAFQRNFDIWKILLDPDTRKTYDDAPNSDDEDYPSMITLDDHIPVTLEDEVEEFVNNCVQNSERHRSARTELPAFS